MDRGADLEQSADAEDGNENGIAGNRKIGAIYCRFDGAEVGHTVLAVAEGGSEARWGGCFCHGERTSLRI